MTPKYLLKTKMSKLLLQLSHYPRLSTILSKWYNKYYSTIFHTLLNVGLLKNITREENQGTMFERRPDAIHLYGTDDLSTDDILHYFADYSPHHIEWIDDTHCKWTGPLYYHAWLSIRGNVFDNCWMWKLCSLSYDCKR